jgi:hypothetical protein
MTLSGRLRCGRRGSNPLSSDGRLRDHVRPSYGGGSNQARLLFRYKDCHR